jgi:ligand-binding SRPBCC domain-containing protein
VKLHTLCARQTLPISVEAAWEFFSDPRNLERITPPSMGFEVRSELPPKMHAGMIVTYRVRPLLGVPVDWVTEITHVDEPEFFVDEQRFGPYRFWHHQHHFVPISGGTEVRDLLHYALPPLPGAGIARRLLVGPRLHEIFQHRREVLSHHFGTLE